LAGIFKVNLACLIFKNLPFYMLLFVALLTMIFVYFWKSEDQELLGYFGIAGLVANIALLTRAWFSPQTFFFLKLAVSNFDLLLVIILSFVSLLALLYSHFFHHSKGVATGTFVGYFLLSIFGLQSAILSNNLLVTFVAIFIVSYSFAFILDLYIGSKKQINKIWHYIILTDIFFLLGISFYFASIGSFHLVSAELLSIIANEAYTANYFRIGLVLITVSLFAKLIVISSKPPLVSIFHYIFRFGYLALLLKLLMPLVNIWSSFLALPIFIIAIAAITYANIAAFKNQNLIDRLEILSIAQIGYIIAFFPGLAINRGDAISGIVLFMILFVISYIGLNALLYYLFGDDKAQSIDGLGRKKPHFAVIVIIFLFALAGLPPFLGFITRFIMLRELAINSFYIPLVFVVLNLMITLYIYMQPISRLYASKGGSFQKEDEFPILMIIATSIAVFTILFLGIFPDSIINWIKLSVM